GTLHVLKNANTSELAQTCSASSPPRPLYPVQDRQDPRHIERIHRVMASRQQATVEEAAAAATKAAGPIPVGG
ncbi:hypothetical protein BGX31_002172, partial [Mortierella sp. GBA43]